MGTGYVGLVAGACFSDSGNHVTCIDVDKEKVARLQQGIIPIYEPGLEELVSRNYKAKRLNFTTDAAAAIRESEAVFIAVGTPSGDDGSLDLKYVMSAIKTIKETITKETIIVMKSTVPVGTAQKVREAMQGAKAPFDVVSNPEFLKEGTAVNDFFKPERVVIGCKTERARRVMGDLYAPYIRSGNPIFFMDNESAELSKYAANAFLAMKISFINELALLAERVGANIQDVRKTLITDSRIGSKFLYPGCGYGGSCFPKDVQAITQLGKQNGLDFTLFQSVHEVNERQKLVLLDKIQKHFKNIKGKTFAVWGLAFKPETDDMREAPSVKLIEGLIAAGAQVRAYDPVANHEAKKYFENKIKLSEDPYEITKGADALAICTEWNEFRTPNFNLLKSNLTNPVIFDGRNLFSRESIEQEGIKYYCIGRPDPI